MTTMMVSDAYLNVSPVSSSDESGSSSLKGEERTMGGAEFSSRLTGTFDFPKVQPPPPPASKSPSPPRESRKQRRKRASRRQQDMLPSSSSQDSLSSYFKELVYEKGMLPKASSSPLRLTFIADDALSCISMCSSQRGNISRSSSIETIISMALSDDDVMITPPPLLDDEDDSDMEEGSEPAVTEMYEEEEPLEQLPALEPIPSALSEFMGSLLQEHQGLTGNLKDASSLDVEIISDNAASNLPTEQVVSKFWNGQASLSKLYLDHPLQESTASLLTFDEPCFTQPLVESSDDDDAEEDFPDEEAELHAEKYDDLDDTTITEDSLATLDFAICNDICERLQLLNQKKGHSSALQGQLQQLSSIGAPPASEPLLSPTDSSSQLGLGESMHSVVSARGSEGYRNAILNEDVSPTGVMDIFAMPEQQWAAASASPRTTVRKKAAAGNTTGLPSFASPRSSSSISKKKVNRLSPYTGKHRKHLASIPATTTSAPSSATPHHT